MRLFHLETNATLLDLRRICEDFAPVKYSSMLLRLDVFSLPPRILHSRRNSFNYNTSFAFFFSPPNLPFSCNNVVHAKFRSVDVANKRSRIINSRRAVSWFDILYYAAANPVLLRVLPTSHGSPHFRIRFRDQMEHVRARFYHLAILVSAAFFPARVKAGQIEF